MYEDDCKELGIAVVHSFECRWHLAHRSILDCNKVNLSFESAAPVPPRTHDAVLISVLLA